MNDRAWYSPVRGTTYRADLTAGSIVLSRSVLTGRTTDVFSDSFDRPPGWSVESHRRSGPAVSPFTPEGSPRFVQWAGFDYLSRDESRPAFGTLAFRRIVLPMWLPALLAALPPVTALARRVRRVRRRRGGLCPRCSYDLTGNVSGTCPECGEPVAKVTE